MLCQQVTVNPSNTVGMSGIMRSRWPNDEMMKEQLFLSFCPTVFLMFTSLLDLSLPNYKVAATVPGITWELSNICLKKRRVFFRVSLFIQRNGLSKTLPADLPLNTDQL